MRFRNFIIAYCSVTLLFPPEVWSAPIPLHPSPKIGVLVVGDNLPPKDERVVRSVQHQVARWLEDLPWEATATPLDVSIPWSRWQVQSEARALVEKLSRLLEGVARRTPFEELAREAESLVVAARSAWAGDVWQRALLVQGYALFSAGRKGEAKSPLLRAISLHPDGTYPAIFPADWDWSETASFDQLVGEIQKQSVRSCRFQVRADTHLAEGKINGFPAVIPGTFDLSPGIEHQLEISSSGGALVKRVLRCSGQSEERIVVAMPKGGGPTDGGHLQQVVREKGLDALFLIDPSREALQFFLYRPSKGIHSIPVQSKVRLADAALSSGRGELPITSDAVVALFSEPASGLSVGKAGVEDWDTFNASAVMAKRRDYKWYNDWKVWAIAGVVVSGFAVAYFASRPSDVKSQSGFAIQLQ